MAVIKYVPANLCRTPGIRNLLNTTAKNRKKYHNIQNIHSKGMNNSIKITNKIIYLTVKLIQSEHIWDHLAYYISFLLKC